MLFSKDSFEKRLSNTFTTREKSSIIVLYSFRKEEIAMDNNSNVQVRSTVVDGLGKRHMMFMPMVCVSSFMLVGYSALDTEAPEILTDTIELELNTEIDPSLINVIDNQDDRSAITVVVDQSSYDPTREGTYVVHVSASDSFNNETSKDITVINKDMKKPVISLKDGGPNYSSDSNILKLRYNSNPDIREYITAMDDNTNSGNNGDLTAFINQETALDTSKLGAQFIDVNVTDDAGNEARQSIPVYIIDDVAPELTLKGDGVATVNYGSQFDLSEYAKAIDEYEGSLQDKIVVEGVNPDTNRLGSTTELKLTVADTSGNKTEKTLKLTVADIEAPRISLSQNNLRTVMKSGKLNVADYVTVTDNYDKDIKSKVSYSASTIDLSTAGDKSVTITATDTAGNTSSETFRVSVLDPATYNTQTVLNAAYSKVGCPYVFGAAGPYAFDCSGFTKWCYAQIGINLPHGSRSQYAGLSEVVYSYDQLVPGDLVFFSTIGWCGHVGIYVGNGMMIDAGSEETGVHYSNINSAYYRNCFVGGGRY